MKRMLHVAFKMSDWMDMVSVLALSFLMTLTVLDVIGRSGGRPIPGAFETVALTGAIVIGFAFPLTSWRRSHVCLDYLLEKLPEGRRNILTIFTRILGILLFLLFGVSLFLFGADSYEAGEVSVTIKLPTYIFMFCAGACCFVESFILFCDIFRILRGDVEGGHHE